MIQIVYNILFTFGLLLFLIGYLSVGNVISKQNDLLFGHNMTEMRQSGSSQEKRLVKQLILFIEDGIRPQYLFGNLTYKEWKPFFQFYLETNPNHTVCSNLQVDPPTSTTQGIKTLLTGGMSSFIELGQTFYSDILVSDHLLKQANRSGLRVYHVGDPIWRELAGEIFVNSNGQIDAYNIDIDDTKDIEEGIHSFFHSSADILIIHSLLLDHNAHQTGSSLLSTPSIYSSLLQFNHHLSSILPHLHNDSLLLVLGDHGLTDHGNHGGATFDEITTGLCVYSPSFSFSSFNRSIHMRDLTSTVSYLLGLPVPFSNLGQPILSILPSTHDYLLDCFQQILAFLKEYSPSHADEFQKKADEYSIEVAIQSIQSVFNHSSIRWSICYLGFLIMSWCLLSSSSSSSISFSFSFRYWICHLLTLSLFSSYTMILSPSSFLSPLLLLYSLSLPSLSFLSILFLFLPLLPFPSSLSPCLLLVFLVSSFLSFSYSFLDLLYLLLFLIAYSTHSPLLSYFTLLFFLFYQIIIKPPKQQLLFFFILLCILLYPHSILPILSSYLFFSSLSHSFNSSHFTWFLLTVCFYYTFLLTPTFTFTSLNWSAAFTFTHDTQLPLQAFSMILSVFWPFTCLFLIYPKERAIVPLMEIVLLCVLSVMYNTASPVIWSVYTPVLLFVSVLWIFLFISFVVLF